MNSRTTTEPESPAVATPSRRAALGLAAGGGLALSSLGQAANAFAAPAGFPMAPVLPTSISDLASGLDLQYPRRRRTPQEHPDRGSGRAPLRPGQWRRLPRHPVGPRPCQHRPAGEGQPRPGTGLHRLRRLGHAPDIGTPAAGQFATMARDFATGLAALRKDLGATRWNSVTVVTTSEFGRRVEVNGDGGTDHGHGNVAFFMGGGIKGGTVYGDIPELVDANLTDGDLPINIDYRQALSEIVRKRLKNDRISDVFPGFDDSHTLGIA